MVAILRFSIITLALIASLAFGADRPFFMNEFGSAPFHYAQQGLAHRGIDIMVRVGTPVIAVADGTVVWLETGFDGRWLHPNLRIKHEDGIQTYYYHIDKIIVEHGQVVRQGQIIAHTAKTGKACPTCPYLFQGAPHLHFETSRQSGEVFDPRELKFTCPSPDSRWWWPVGCDSYKGFIVPITPKLNKPELHSEPEEPLVELSAPK
jgi:murein DD-endopeptidase MepM/ murein hydrolase activator NlpD